MELHFQISASLSLNYYGAPFSIYNFFAFLSPNMVGQTIPEQYGLLIKNGYLNECMESSAFMDSIHRVYHKLLIITILFRCSMPSYFDSVHKQYCVQCAFVWAHKWNLYDLSISKCCSKVIFGSVEIHQSFYGIESTFRSQSSGANILVSLWYWKV